MVGITSAGGSVEVPFIPSSPMELFFTAVLCVVSIVVLAYTMVMLYRCVCSRNYAEWRASWACDREGVTVDGSTQVRHKIAALSFQSIYRKLVSNWIRLEQYKILGLSNLFH